MPNFANSTLTEKKENSPDSPEAPPGSAPDGGSQVTPLFSTADGRANDGSAEQDRQPVVSDHAVREQVQRVRLDLLARETERLDRRLVQILDQQMEDRQLRERLQVEVGNLCQRVDQLIGTSESGPTARGTDLRTTVKPLLQAVLDMLDGPAQRPSGQTGSAPRPQGPSLPQPGHGQRASAPAAQGTPSGRAAAASPTASSAGAQPAGSALPPAPEAPRPARSTVSPTASPARPDVKPVSQDWSVEEVEARAVALQKALSRLDRATKPVTPRPQPEPPTASPPAARTEAPRPRPDPAPAGKAVTPQPHPDPAPTGKAVPPRQGSGPAATFDERLPTPPRRPESLDELEDPLGAEDPTIEIARLLRPVEARTQSQPQVQRPDPTAESAAAPPGVETTPAPPTARRPAESEPLLLGTGQTPRIGEGAEPAAGAKERSVPAPATGPTGLARRARDMAASDHRPAAAPGRSPGGRDSTARPPTGSTDKRPEPSATPASPAPKPEPLGETLPRCLTEPWDDADPDWLQVGQDKGGRRWPFRRPRPAGDAADRRDEDRPAPQSSRRFPDDGTEQPK